MTSLSYVANTSNSKTKHFVKGHENTRVCQSVLRISEETQNDQTKRVD